MMPTTTIAPGLEARHLLKALRSFKRGDFSVRLPSDLTGIGGDIAEAFNEVVELNEEVAREFQRLGRVVGKEGRIGERGKLSGATGEWEACINSVNGLIEDMVQPTTEVARVIAPSRCINVDFPHPDGPMMATNSPALTRMLTPRNASTSIFPTL